MKQRGTSLVEAMVIVAIILVLIGAIAIPSYRNYAASRAATDAAATLAEDIALLERTAQTGKLNQGSSLIVESDDPFVYRCYYGRPADVDPGSSLGAVVVERIFSSVALAGGPINSSTPLLFASNGSAQYVSDGTIASQHETIEFSLASKSGGKTARVDLNLFTGSVSVP